MRGLVRGAELLHVILLSAFLLGPLLYFAGVAAPWKTDAAALFANPSVRASLVNSVVLAASTAVLSTGFGFVFSWLLWRYRWPTRLARVVSLGLKVPYLLPQFFFAIGWIALAAPQVGYLNRFSGALGLPPVPTIYGLGGTIFVFVLWSTALAMIQMQVFFAQYAGHLEDAAIMCGASPLKTFFKVTVPLARPRLFNCMLLTSVNALAAFSVPAMLASPARTYVATTRIYQSIKSSQDFSQAGLLSLTLLGFTLLLLLAQRFLVTANLVSLITGKATRPALLEPARGAKLVFAGAAAFGVISCLLPCSAVVIISLLRDRSDLMSWTLEKYSYVFGQMPEGLLALRNSLITSSVAAFGATFIGLVLAYGAARLRYRASSTLIQTWDIGYALPCTVIALSLIVAFSGRLTNTLSILMIAYMVKYAAFSLRTLTPAMSAVSKELEEAAWMSGASPVRGFFSILIPMLKPAIAAAVFLALVPMLSELTMSVLLTGPGTETLGTLVFRLQEYADPGSAAVLAVAVAAATLILNTTLKALSKGAFGI